MAATAVLRVAVGLRGVFINCKPRVTLQGTIIPIDCFSLIRLTSCSLVLKHPSQYFRLLSISPLCPYAHDALAIQCYAFILHPKTSAYGIGGYGGQNYYGDSGNYQQREYQPSYQHQGKGGYRGGYQGKNYQEDYQEQQEGFPDEGFDELGGEDLEDDEEMNEIFAAMDSMGVTDVVLHSILILPFEHKLRPLSWC